MALTAALLCMLIIQKKEILNLGNGLTSGLDDTTITGETEHSINL